MKKLYHHLRDHLILDWNPAVYGLTFLFLTLFLVFNYGTGWFLDLTFGAKDMSGKLPWFYLVMGVPYLVVMALQAWNGQLDLATLRRPGLWLMLLLGLSMVCITMWVDWHRQLAMEWFPADARRWALYMLWHAKRVVFILAPLCLYVWWQRRQDPGLLGLRQGDFSPKTYFLILGMVLPLLVAASFNERFLSTYPYYQPVQGEPDAAFRLITMEMAYAADFFSVEWLYRGFFVIGMARFLGPRAVLPMAAMYCAIHIAKPPAEAIASFLGGYALGVFSLRTQSIWGGVIVHMGQAVILDLLALLQEYVLGRGIHI